MKDVADLYTLSREQIVDALTKKDRKTTSEPPGKIADNLLASIEISKSRPLNRLITALGIRGVGEVVAADLARSYTDLRAPAFYNESLGLTKRTALAERINLIFRAEYFNPFNRTQFAAPAANISNRNFGTVSGQANTPRQGQLALRLEF